MFLIKYWRREVCSREREGERRGKYREGKGDERGPGREKKVSNGKEKGGLEPGGRVRRGSEGGRKQDIGKW